MATTTTEKTTEPTEKPEDTLATKGKDGVPAAYDFKVPEGMELPKETLDKVTPIFRDLGLNQEQAQKMFDLHQELVKESQEAPVKYYEKMRGEWRDEVVKDRYLGDGKDNLSAAARQDINAAFNAIGDPRTVEEFKEAMNLTGVGDHPAFLRAFAALGKQFREGTAVAGKGPSPAGQVAPGAVPKSVAAAMYPNLPSAS